MSQSELPKISVVTVSLNQGEFIRDCIESVLRQGYPHVEHIVVDGGSTDGTIDILKSYPHLMWSSEPDRNQCHALNKGFSRARGEIIAWLNADDWYGDGTFHRVADALHNYPVVLTKTVETDRAGMIRQCVDNGARTFHDLLRYWIPYGWVSQNGVFFRRDLLEEVKYAPGIYVDEDLDLCMDYDLWLRMAQRFPFTTWLDHIGGYFRVYETNKTGRNGLAVQREFSRVFRRHLYRLSAAEREVAVVLIVDELSESIKDTIGSLARQTIRNFEIIFLDCLSDPSQRAQLKSIAATIQQATNTFGVRYLAARPAEGPSALAALMGAIHAPLCAVVWSGDVLADDFMQQVVNAFAVDATGVLLPLGADAERRKLLLDPMTQRPQLSALFADLPLPSAFAARSMVIAELADRIKAVDARQWVRELVCRALWRGWHVSVENQVSVSERERAASIADRRSFDLAQARLILELKRDAESEPFAPTRAKFGWMPVIDESCARVASDMQNVPGT